MSTSPIAWLHASTASTTMRRDDRPPRKSAEPQTTAASEAEGDRAQTGVAVRSQGRMSRSAPRIARVAGERFRV